MDMNGFSNSLKTWTLMAALGGILVAVGGLIGGQTGIVLAFGFAILLNGFVYWKSDSIALKANGARELAPGEQPRLVSIVGLLADRAGIPMPRVYIVDRPEPNAFATGRHPAARASGRPPRADRGDDHPARGVPRPGVPRGLHGGLAHRRPGGSRAGAGDAPGGAAGARPDGPDARRPSEARPPGAGGEPRVQQPVDRQPARRLRRRAAVLDAPAPRGPDCPPPGDAAPRS